MKSGQAQDGDDDDDDDGGFGRSQFEADITKQTPPRRVKFPQEDGSLGGQNKYGASPMLHVPKIRGAQLPMKTRTRIPAALRPTPVPMVERQPSSHLDFESPSTPSPHGRRPPPPPKGFDPYARPRSSPPARKERDPALTAPTLQPLGSNPDFESPSQLSSDGSRPHLPKAFEPQPRPQTRRSVWKFAPVQAATANQPLGDGIKSPRPPSPYGKKYWASSQVLSPHSPPLTGTSALKERVPTLSSKAYQPLGYDSEPQRPPSPPHGKRIGSQLQASRYAYPPSSSSFWNEFRPILRDHEYEPLRLPSPSNAKTTGILPEELDPYPRPPSGPSIWEKCGTVPKATDYQPRSPSPQVTKVGSLPEGFDPYPRPPTGPSHWKECESALKSQESEPPRSPSPRRVKIGSLPEGFDPYPRSSTLPQPRDQSSASPATAATPAAEGIKQETEAADDQKRTRRRGGQNRDFWQQAQDSRDSARVQGQEE